MFSMMCTWTNCSANARHAGDLRRHRTYYDVTVMWRIYFSMVWCQTIWNNWAIYFELWYVKGFSFMHGALSISLCLSIWLARVSSMHYHFFLNKVGSLYARQLYGKDVHRKGGRNCLWWGNINTQSGCLHIGSKLITRYMLQIQTHSSVLEILLSTMTNVFGKS